MPNPIEFVRVTDKSTGHELTIPREAWEGNRDLFAQVQKPAVDDNGDPLPPTHASATDSGTKSGQKAATPKEK